MYKLIAEVLKIMEKYSKQHLLEMSLDEDTTQANIFAFITFSTFKLRDINTCIDPSLRVGEKNVCGLLQYMYDAKGNYEKMYGENEHELYTNNFFDNRILEIFQELDNFAKYFLFQDINFYKQHPKLFKETLDSFMLEDESKVNNYSMNLDYVLNIPKEYLEELFSRKNKLVLSIPYTKESAITLEQLGGKINSFKEIDPIFKELLLLTSSF